MRHVDINEVYDYLDALRESGDTNMYGAGPYLQEEFDVTRREAHDLLKGWMDSYGERNADAGNDQ